jgi:hypothetical protein
MVSLFPPLPPHRNFPLRINVKCVRQQDKNLEIAKGVYEAKPNPFAISKFAVDVWKTST